MTDANDETDRDSTGEEIIERDGVYYRLHSGPAGYSIPGPVGADLDEPEEDDE